MTHKINMDHCLPGCKISSISMSCYGWSGWLKSSQRIRAIIFRYSLAFKHTIVKPIHSAEKKPNNAPRIIKNGHKQHIHTGSIPWGLYLIIMTGPPNKPITVTTTIASTQRTNNKAKKIGKKGIMRIPTKTCTGAGKSSTQRLHYKMFTQFLAMDLCRSCSARCSSQLSKHNKIDGYIYRSYDYSLKFFRWKAGTLGIFSTD